MESADSKLSELIAWFKRFDSVLVAFSGGVDSTLVAKVAHMVLGHKAYAATACSPSIPERELKEAAEIAKLIGIKQIFVNIDETSRPEYARNMLDRCYFCKEEMCSKFLELAASLGVKQVVDGTNFDDLKDFRLGIEAARKLGVRSPLAELGIGKELVREISKLLGLPTALKPSSPCLASRIAYGHPITAELLKKVAMAEEFIRTHVNLKVLRVRVHGDIVRIEVGKDERHLMFNVNLMDKIAGYIKSLGFTFVTLDLEGYRQGSFLESIRKTNKHVIT
ncbi:MAG: ATP-dependent sacrificial sulfur transferase LarE [Nitrososphaerota archaeon]|nr:ATP-dependent sacrificial sulfur transferase LarE [Aigarchaeota archaeon]MDW8077173.1 ATP-dependent sacrificial sulfur transferase LarE [Nitrososphaerota archaeon]